MIDSVKESENGVSPQVRAKAAGSKTTPPITSLCCYTRNRPDSLERLLVSSAQSIRNNERQVRIVVTDQSDALSTRSANIELLKKTQREFDIPCFYAAQDEKKQFAEQLSKHADVDPDITRFAFCQDENGLPAYGANRNALLLATIDELTLHLSDDIVCQFTRAVDAQESIALTSLLSPQNITHLREDEFSSYAETAETDDIFWIHELLLGKSLTECIKEHSSAQIAADLESCDKTFWGKLPPRHVAVTSAGFVGDTAMGPPYWALLARESRNSFIHSEDKYRFCFERQIVARVAKKLTIAERGSKGGPCEGLDNRQQLPPFTPIQRGEDVIFGKLLEIGSSGYVGYLPWMAHHRRPSSHCFEIDEVIQFATSASSFNIMTAVLEDTQIPNCSDISENLFMVGRILKEWGALPRDEFHESVRLKLAKRWQKEIELIETLMSTYEQQPTYWAEDVAACLAGLKAAVQNRDLVLGSDFAGSGGSVNYIEMTQMYMTKFGALLEIWLHCVKPHANYTCAAFNCSDQFEWRVQSKA